MSRPSRGDAQYSVLIPWADRPQLEVSLRRNGPLLTRHGVEIVIVNAGGDYDSLIGIVNNAALPNVVAVNLPGATFNRSLCGNVAALVSTGQYVFVMDADIVLTSDIFTEALDDLQSGSRFVAIQRIRESESRSTTMGPLLEEIVSTTELVMVDGRRAVLRGRYSPRGVRGGDGLVLVACEHLRGVGGLSSNLIGWGYEDTDFQIRLQLVLGLERCEAGEVIHLTHDADRNMEEWRQKRNLCFQSYARGENRGTFDEDARNWAGHLVMFPASAQRRLPIGACLAS
jgi:glycosyltransferase involved in cell wall biosynthesis